MDIQGGKQVQAKGIENTFNKVILILKTSKTLRKRWSFRYRSLLGDQTDQKKKPLQGILQLKHTVYRTREECGKLQERSVKGHIKVKL
jgi:hypothetical protein